MYLLLIVKYTALFLFQLKIDNLVVSCKDENGLLKALIKDALETKVLPLADQLASFCQRLGHFESQHTVLVKEITDLRNMVLNLKERVETLEQKSDENLAFEKRKKGMSNLRCTRKNENREKTNCLNKQALF